MALPPGLLGQVACPLREACDTQQSVGHVYAVPKFGLQLHAYLQEGPPFCIPNLELARGACSKWLMHAYGAAATDLLLRGAVTCP